jgi:hypothetical protein
MHAMLVCGDYWSARTRRRSCCYAVTLQLYTLSPAALMQGQPLSHSSTNPPKLQRPDFFVCFCSLSPPQTPLLACELLLARLSHTRLDT